MQQGPVNKTRKKLYVFISIHSYSTKGNSVLYCVGQLGAKEVNEVAELTVERKPIGPGAGQPVS